MILGISLKMDVILDCVTKDYKELIPNPIIGSGIYKFVALVCHILLIFLQGGGQKQTFYGYVSPEERNEVTQNINLRVIRT